MTFLEATYEDGYVLREDELDHSPYDSGRNVFHAILNKRPEPIHGKLVRFALVTPENTYAIDWTKLPDNARPVRFKHMERDLHSDGTQSDPRIVLIDFGYQYTDEEGKNVQDIVSV